MTFEPFAVAYRVLAAGIVTAAVACPQGQIPARGFVSSRPATTWEEGLICGNGTLGANALSRPLDETIVFTHERLFLPTGQPILPPNLAPRLAEVRSLIDDGKYREATHLTFAISEQRSFRYPDPFVPAFDLRIQMEPAGKVKDYARSVDFTTGEATVRWTDDRGQFVRRLFVSRADQVAVLSIEGPELTLRFDLRPRHLSEGVDPKTVERSDRRFEQAITDLEIAAEPGALTWRNRFADAYPGSIQTLEGMLRIETEGGRSAPDGTSLRVVEAERVLAFVDLELVRDPSASRQQTLRDRIARLPRDYDELLKRHARLHGELFSRMRLDLGGGSDRALTTEELLAKSTTERLNRALIEKEFDAGRHNIISCTGELPPNLQGAWGGTYVPGWASDYTHNGNVPSAIASMLMGNTPELMLAYTSYLESLTPGLEANARRIFGARGIVLPSRTSTNGFNNSFAPEFAGAFWVGGAAWAAHFFYDYYLYTGDREFLAQHALPFMTKAAVFFEDYLYEGPDGKLVFSPTQSPENTPGNTNSQGSFNATMDVAAARELLRNVITASEELSVNADKIPLWRSMLDKMPPYLIGPDGVVKEWLTPKLEDRLGHRHTSQLYALYDGMPEEIARDPALRAAFKKIIEIKLERHWQESSGFMSFGLVQLGLAAASLGEGELAHRCLVHLVNRYWLTNLASMHNHRSLFNMDISGGMPAVIIKMLVASDPGRVALLPALPTAWPTGAIEGVLCRGQIEVERLAWDTNGLVVTLRSARDQTIVLAVPFAIESIAIENGDASVRDADEEHRRQVALSAGESVTLRVAR